MSDIKLTDYLPDATTIDDATLSEVRGRIITYLESQFPDSIDTAPNSVFGDLVLGPLSYMVASFEIGASRIFSDIDLANVASGTVYNCDFVQKYLENFGLSQRNSTKTTGVVQITFDTPGTYTIDAGAAIVFKAQEGDILFEMSGVTDQLIVRSDLESGEETTSLRQLNKISDNEYIVNIPVEGTAGVTVNKNDTAKSNITIGEISSIVAVADFDPGVLPENVMELANKSRNTYYAASLASRNGTLSFLLQTYPELQGVSPVVSGDNEMLRGGNNMFGIKHGVMDIFVKSKKNLLKTTVTQKLGYNVTTDTWMGLLEKPQGPPILLESLVPSNSDSAIEFDVFSKASNIKQQPGISHTYSKNESLGCVVTSQEELTTEDPSLLYTPTIPTTLGALSITGQCQASLMKPAAIRQFTVSFNSYDTTSYTKLTLTVSDNTESFVIDLMRDPADTDNDDAVLYSFNPDGDFKKFLNGVNIAFSLNTASKGALQQLAELIDKDYTETFTAKPKTANFTATYTYDPLITNIAELTVGNDVKPINCEIQVRGFIPCVVNNLTVVYRSKSGSSVDLEAARTDIANYVNGITYPNLYETYTVAELLLYHGADGVKSVTQQGVFYPCVAPYIINPDSSFNIDNFTTWGPKKINEEFGYKCDPVYGESEPKHTVTSNTLLPAKEVLGMGDRNIQYILSAENIVFDEVSF
tara:strand:- start:2191 stop:4284 length:2094 start_codon:yes stop_codon:yes gene_type:complete